MEKQERPKVQKWNGKISKIGLVAILATLITALLSMQALVTLQTKHSEGMLTSTTATVNAVVIVFDTCSFSTSNTAINFNTIIPGTNTIGTGYGNTIAAITNTIAVTNGGYNPSNVYLSGSNWNYFGTNTFLVTNTVWSGLSANQAWNPVANAISGGGNKYTFQSNTEVQLSAVQQDTLNSISNGGSASFWFGVNVPSGQLGGTYSQTINVISTC